MWELGHEEGWVLKNWCFWTVVLEKTLESPLDGKEIQPKGDQPWIFTGRSGAEAPVFWSFDMKSQLIGKIPDPKKDWGQKEKRVSEDEMAGWHHWWNGHAFGQTLGDGEGQRGLVCCSPWGAKSWTQLTRQLNNNHLAPSSALWWPRHRAEEHRKGGLCIRQEPGIWGKRGCRQKQVFSWPFPLFIPFPSSTTRSCVNSVFKGSKNRVW